MTFFKIIKEVLLKMCSGATKSDKFKHCGKRTQKYHVIQFSTEFSNIAIKTN